MAGTDILLTVEKLIPGGDGMGHLDGKVYFIPGVLPGERVRARVVRETRGWSKTGPAEVLEASPHRARPFCPLYGVCGGCSWQHIDHAAQREAKMGMLIEALRRQGGMDLPAPVEIPSPPRGYRNRIRVKVMPGERAGFRRRGSRDTVPVAACPVAAVGVNKFLSNPPKTLKIGEEPVVYGDAENYWVEGRDGEARVVVKNRPFSFSPGSFFQSNLAPLGPMVDFALHGAAGDRALDLFGGAGLFGAFAAEKFDRVIGVDRDRNSEASWLRNVGPRGIFFAMSLEEWVDVGKEPKRPDFVVVDPPRAGLSPAVRRGLKKLAPRRLSYVSCDPVTLARDLADLADGPFAVEAWAIADLYPQTPHIETVVRLVSRG